MHERRAGSGANGSAWLLNEQNGCRTLRLPESPTLEIGYGIDRPDTCPETGRPPARFRLTVRSDRAGATETLLEREMALPSTDQPPSASSGSSLRRETLPLERYAGQAVELCLTLTTEPGEPTPACFVWEVPRIHNAAEHPREGPAETSDPEIEKLQRERLEALGYVN